MQKDYTDVTFLLDRSGSMDSIWSDVAGGFKRFVDEQKAQPGKCIFSLYAFDDAYDVFINARPVSEVNGLPAGLLPRNMTALLDAMGKAITDTGARLRALPEVDRPEKVVFVIQTDGMENASREFNLVKISEMIREQTDKYNWQFVFLGANMDSIQEGGRLGIAAGTSVNWKASPIGVSNAYQGLSQKLSSYRGGGVQSMAFNAGEKTAIEDDSVLIDPNNPLSPPNIISP